jgi:hypothetical protein
MNKSTETLNLMVNFDPFINYLISYGTKSKHYYGKHFRFESDGRCSQNS